MAMGKGLSRVGAAIVLIASATFALPASANSAVGRWTFETAVINACTLSGEMTITPAKTPQAGKGELACSFTVVQACPGPPPLEIRVAQTCSGRQINSFVTLDSQIDRIISVKPESRRAGMEDRYAPDNFRVALNADGSEMTGQFLSIGQAFVRFVRKPDLSS